MWSKRDAAQALLAAVLFLIVGLLLFPPVGASCQHNDHGYACLLVIQASPRNRECWFIALAPARRSWRVKSVVAIEQCPALKLVHHGPRALKQ